MLTLNEEFHVPDPNAGYELIKNLYNKVYEQVLIWLFSSKDKIKGDSDTIEGNFIIGPELNPGCKWFGYDNIFRYKVIFTDGEEAAIGNFSEAEPGLGEIKPGDEIVKIPDSIHYGSINIILYVNSLVFRNRFNGVKLINKQLDKLKITLRHELEHAYKEIKVQNIFKVRDESNKQDENYLNPSEFINGYDELMHAQRAANTDEEKMFLNMLYRSNYLERDAHVAGFFQRCLNDVEERFTIKPLSSYFEWREYNELLDFLKNFHNVEIYKKHQQIIAKLFGNGAIKNGLFRKKMRQNIQKALDKMKKIHNVMERFVKGVPRQFDLEKARKEYYRGIQECLGWNPDFQKEFSMINEVYVRDYVQSRLAVRIRMIESFFRES